MELPALLDLTVLEETTSQVLLVHLVLQVAPEIKVQLTDQAHLAHLVHQEIQAQMLPVLLVPMAHLDPKEPNLLLANPVHLDQSVTLGQWAPLQLQAYPVHLVLQDLRDQQVIEVQLVVVHPGVHQVHGDHLAHRVNQQRDLQVVTDQLDPLVFQALPDLNYRLVLRVGQDHLVQRETKDHLVFQGLNDHLVVLVTMDPKVQLVLLDRKDHLAKKVHVARKAPKDLMVNQDQLVQLVPLATKDYQDHPANQVHKALKSPQVHVDHQDLLVLKVVLEVKGFPDLMVPAAYPDRKALLVQMENKDRSVKRVVQDLLELQYLHQRVHVEHQGALDLRDLPVKTSLDHPVLQDLLEMEAWRDLVDWLVIVVMTVLLAFPVNPVPLVIQGVLQSHGHSQSMVNCNK